ncbi:hypothetical protein [Singulisphaera sp. PoT]|uniref:hypothetical protein n=1 Tax=Singulisphaera sp. PoT TaxID=3411797 RepID=UPI003BF60207
MRLDQNPRLVVRPMTFWIAALLFSSGLSNLSRADGLVFRLPTDGTEVVFREEIEFQVKSQLLEDGRPSTKVDLPEQKGKQAGLITIGSVGRASRAGQECRWIELRRATGTGSGPEHVLKMLIPEAYLKQGEDPLAHAILTFFNPKPIDVANGLKEEGFDRIQYEIDRFRPVFPETLREMRELPKRSVKTAVATYEECRVLAGKTRFDRPLLGKGRWTNESDWEITLNPAAPFGVVQILCSSETDEIGPEVTNHIRARSSLILDRIGTGARSMLPASGGDKRVPAEKAGSTPRTATEPR